MTLWQSGGMAFGYAVYAIAWVLGGRPERFGAGLLLLSNLCSGLANAWGIGGFYPGFMAMDVIGLLMFGRMCFLSDRWWPTVAAAGFGLIVLGDAIRLMNPAFSHDTMVSGKIGLGYVIDLALLLGVWERRLAGERPAGLAAWSAVERITAAQRDRRVRLREKRRTPSGTTHPDRRDRREAGTSRRETCTG